MKESGLLQGLFEELDVLEQAFPKARITEVLGARAEQLGRQIGKVLPKEHREQSYMDARTGQANILERGGPGLLLWRADSSAGLPPAAAGRPVGAGGRADALLKAGRGQR